jgi:hypothetical protein
VALSTPADREFKVLRKGFIRDSVVLANFREGLRALVNPETGAKFTEEEIARATRPGSRWYNEAQAIDDYGQGEQRNALYLADQIQLDKATGRWLLNFHGRLWDVSHLEASGGSGLVEVRGTIGTIVLGDTVLNTPGAYKARDPAGNIYQVFTTATVGAFGTVPCVLAAISTGASTNLEAGTVLTWTERDPNMAPTATVLAPGFSGGHDRETDAELVSRIYSIIRHRPGAGNDPNYRAWGREASSAIEDTFVYPTALHAGSVIVTFTQKRGTAKGPLARIPSPSTLATGIAHITPPTSPVVPTRTFVIGTPPASEPCDLVISLGLQRASSSGWRDAQPFPSNGPDGIAFVVLVSSPTVFRFVCTDATLPGKASGATATGSDVPHIALWNQATSQFVPVIATSIQDLTGGLYEVTHQTPGLTVTTGQWVSPFIARGALIAEALTGYFDALGPGELFNLETDTRGQRARRFPSANEEWPYRAGATAVTAVLEALGSTSLDGALAYIS